MTESAFTIAVRVHACPRCAAPLKVELDGGRIECEHCSASVTVNARPTETYAHTIDSDGERLEHLREQLERNPKKSRYAIARVPRRAKKLSWDDPRQTAAELLALWNDARRVAKDKPGDDRAQYEAFWCSIQLQKLYGKLDQPWRRRAVLESALDCLADPGHRHIVRCNLARAADRAGDLDAARAWLSECDSRPEDVDQDTAYRVSSASIARAQGDHRKVLRQLGVTADELPIAESYRLLADQLRIHAHERLGDDARALVQAKAAATSWGRDKLLRWLETNELAPRTAATLARS